VPSFGGIPTFVGTQIAPICSVHELANPVYKGRLSATVTTGSGIFGLFKLAIKGRCAINKYAINPA
jgi:hypothetical protein